MNKEFDIVIWYEVDQENYFDKWLQTHGLDTHFIRYRKLGDVGAMLTVDEYAYAMLSMCFERPRTQDGMDRFKIPENLK